MSQTVDPGRAPRPRASSRALPIVVASWLGLCSLAFLVTMLATVRTFAWPQPTYDQFRLYRIYVEHPFPANVLQLENQHRPVFPGLVRVLELHLWNADQRLQIAFGLVCVLLTLGVMVAIVVRTQRLPFVARAAGVTAVVVALLWLGNARMLLHGNELVHVYLLTMALALASWAVAGAARGSVVGLSASTAAAVVATFCFGPGIAVFPAIMLVGWVNRAPVRAHLVWAAACASCLVLYLFMLPGDGSVRGVLELHPWQSAYTAARWIASPWVNGWLGFADPPLAPVHAALMSQGPGAWLVTSANALQSISGARWSEGLAFAIGAAGLLAAAAALLQAIRRREPLDRMRALALILMTFGAASAAIVSVGRLDYLRQHADQVFADRYLVWSCLFWLGLALWWLASSRRSIRIAWITACALLPVALWPTHELGAGWGAVVYRSNQASAAGARSDVLDRDVFWPEDPSVTMDDKLRSLALFRRDGLAMFAGDGMQLLGAHWDGPIVEAAARGVRVEIAPAHAVEDVRGGRTAVRFSAEVRSGVSLVELDAPLVVVDDRSRIVGYGIVSHVADGRSPLRWAVPRKRGVDAYIRNYRASERYRLLLLDLDSRSALVLGALPPTVR